jgi:hypothetical protein
MLRRIRDAGPAMLVPLAWLFVAGTQLTVVGTDAIFVAHLVMAAFIAAFALTGWSEMDTGALRAWRIVLVVGLGVTLAGILGFWLDEPLPLVLSLVGLGQTIGIADATARSD